MTFLTSTPGAGAILPEGTTGLIVKPVTELALPFQTALATYVPTSTHNLVIPIVDEDAAAEWTAEGQEIVIGEPVLSELEVIPGKVAGLVPVSREMAHDSNPAAQQVVGDSLARSIVRKVNAAFVGNLAAPAPKGLGSIVPTVLTGTLDNLDVVLRAKAAIKSAGGTPTGILTSPDTALVLATLKEATDSNRNLLEDAATVAGLPVFEHADVPAGTIWVLDSSRVYTTLREDVTVDVSEDAFFSSDRIGVRAIMRVGFGFPYPEAVVRIDATTV